MNKIIIDTLVSNINKLIVFNYDKPNLEVSIRVSFEKEPIHNNL